MGVVAALTALTVGVACDPKDDPVVSTMPPRDPDGAALRSVTVDAGSIEAHTYSFRPNISASDRVLVGAWEGLEARAFIQFDRDSFFVTLEGDTLTGALVLDATLSYNCVPGQGDTELALRVLGVAGGEENAWAEDSLEWPGPDLLAESLETTLENCESEDDFPERELAVPPAAIEAWIADPIDNNGLAIETVDDLRAFGAGGAMLQFASSENNFAFLDSVGTITTPPGPRLRFRAALDGGAGDTVSVFVGTATVRADAYAASPDEAELPCADPADCIEVGRGAAHRSIFRIDLPDLPRGSNVHQATLTLNALGHPRFDAQLDLEVYRLIADWPGEGVVDSLVEFSGLLWHTATLDSAGTSVEVPITNLVQAWYDDVFDNEGFLLRASREDASLTTESFAGPTHPTVALRPEIEIVYTEPFGGRP